MSTSPHPLHQRLLGAALRAARHRQGLKRKESRPDRMARNQAGLPHQDAPSRVGVCLRTLDAHERGERPLKGTFVRYAAAYETTVRALLEHASRIEIPE